MFKDWFTTGLWMIILSIGGGSVHVAAKKMRLMAIEQVSKPWPSLKIEMKQNNDADPFVIVNKNGKTYILHKDRIRKK